ncbi:MAG TPA: hypothetical protein VMD31_16445 [Opitutaceae bacterium]|nr:hypothetical protein [Opitutaceae bacterium]
MILRWFLASVFGVATLAALAMTVVTWAEPDAGRWMFLAFAALFGLLTGATVFPPKPKPETSTRFVPAWFFDGAVLALAILILLVIGSCLFGRK